MAERKNQSVVFRKVIVQSYDYTYDEFMNSFDQGDYTKHQLNILWDKLYKEYDDVKQDPIVWIKETTYTTTEEERLTESCVIKALDNWQESDEISKFRDRINKANENNKKKMEFINSLPRTLNKKEHQQIFKDFPQLLRKIPFKIGYDKAEWSYNNNNKKFSINFIKEENNDVCPLLEQVRNSLKELRRELSEYSKTPLGKKMDEEFNLLLKMQD
jgi:RNAse (barnase) inhibitor barstar